MRTRPRLARIVLAACDAAARGNVELLRQVVSTKAGVRALDAGDYDRRTPMHLAASEGRLEAVTLMLSRGVIHSPVDRWEHTPLDDAMRHGHQRIVAVLRSIGSHARTRP